MSFSLIAQAYKYAGPADTTIATTDALNISAGDLIVIHVAWSDTPTTLTSITDGGSNTTTNEAVLSDGNWESVVVGYILSAAANASALFTATLGDSKAARSITVSQFRSAGSTITKDRSVATGTGSDTSVVTGTITTTGTDEVVIAGGRPYSATISAQQIGGANADGTYNAVWHRILTSTMTDGAATATLDPSSHWAWVLSSFKATAGGLTFTAHEHRRMIFT